MVRPSALAALRLTTSSNRLDCSTGSSRRPGTLEDLVHEAGGTVVELGKAGLERHEAAGRDEFAHPVHDRQPMLRRELDDALPVANQHEIAHHDQAVEALPPG